MRKQVPLLLTGLAALWVVAAHFVFQLNQLRMMATTDRWFQVIVATMTLVGAVNLTRIHGTNIQRRKTGYLNSIALLFTLYGFLVMGLYYGNTSREYRWVFNATVVPMEATMFSIIAFYIASAAFRSFRIRAAEAAVMGLVAMIVMLGNVPIGPVISEYIPQARTWLMDIPTGAGFRAIRIGTFLGTFAAALRIALGLERAHLGGDAPSS